MDPGLGQIWAIRSVCNIDILHSWFEEYDFWEKKIKYFELRQFDQRMLGDYSKSSKLAMDFSKTALEVTSVAGPY